MSAERATGPYGLNDGLGQRQVLMQPPHGRVEVLSLSAALASHESAEAAIRARAARLADIDEPSLSAVRRVEREDASVLVVADVVEGIRLADLLRQLEKSGDILSHAAMLELAGGV